MVLVLVFLVVFVGLAISVTGARRGGLRRRFWPTPDTTDSWSAGGAAGDAGDGHEASRGGGGSGDAGH